MHNREGKEIIVRSAVDMHEAITALLKQATRTINKDVFGGRDAIELKPAFINRLILENPPIYKDINIPYAIDVDKIWPLIEGLEHSAKADIIITFFRPALAYFDEAEKLMKGAAGVAYGNLYAGRQIAMQITVPPSDYDVPILLHELGHLLGMDHPDESFCARTKSISCPANWKDSIIMDEFSKKAWHNFYLQKKQ